MPAPRTPDILALGEPMIEFNQTGAGNGRQYLQGFGGDTSNFAIAAARQGARVTVADTREAPPHLATLRQELPQAAFTAGAFDASILDGVGTKGLAVPKSNWALPIDQGPFHGYVVTCGITFTFGGLKINTEAQVLDLTDKVIPGLYAAGELVGGIFFQNYPGGTGLLNGSVFGRLSGKNAGLLAKAG